MKKIAQIGTFDVENFGDLLFPDVLNHYLKNSFEIDLYSPNGGIKPFGDNVVYKIKDLETKIDEYSAIIIGGGDIIRTDEKICIVNDEYDHSTEPSLELWMYPILIAKKHGVPVLFNAVGITSDFTDEEKYIVKTILSFVDYISVRDNESKISLEKIGIDNVKIVPDTVLSISSIMNEELLDNTYIKLLKEEEIPNLNDFIIFQHNTTNIENPQYYKDLISFIQMVSKKVPILLMPIGYIHDDDLVLEKIYKENIKNVYKVNFNRKLSPLEMISIFKHSSGFIGTSMHGSVVSASFEKKIMAINSMNAKKVHGFYSIINKDILDVNISSNYSYIFEKNFYNQKTKLNSAYISKIENHFKEMISIINSINSNKVTDFDIYNKYFEYINEQTIIIGQYYNDKDGFLKRSIFKYKHDDNYIMSKFKIKKGKNYIYPIITFLNYIEELYINNEKIELSDSYFNKDKYVIYETNNDKEIIIRIKFHKIDDSFVNEKMKNITKKYNESIKAIEKLNNDLEKNEIEYRNLEEKYCELLKK